MVDIRTSFFVIVFSKEEDCLPPFSLITLSFRFFKNKFIPSNEINKLKCSYVSLRATVPVQLVD